MLFYLAVLSILFAKRPSPLLSTLASPRPRKCACMNDSLEQHIRSQGILFGKYRLLAKLAQGGMAELFLAQQEGLAGFSKKVAIKCILPHFAQKEDFITMFLDEARIAAHLNHPNVVQILDIGEVNGVYYMAMEYIPGQNIKEVHKKLYTHPQYKTRPPYELVASIFAQACAGLDHVHNSKDQYNQPLHLVHRDISPNNLLLSYDGVLKIVDFGVAKARSQEYETEVGVLKGRLSYMSPEQLSAQPIDGRSDLFALGIVLYEVTTHKRLFRRRSEAETIQALLTNPIPPPTRIIEGYPKALEDIVLRTLRRKPEERYQDAAEMRHALEEYIASTGRMYGGRQAASILEELFPDELQKEKAGRYDHYVNQQDLLNLSRGSYRVIRSHDHSMASIQITPPDAATHQTGAWQGHPSQILYNPGTPQPSPYQVPSGTYSGVQRSTRPPEEDLPYVEQVEQFHQPVPTPKAPAPQEDATIIAPPSHERLDAAPSAQANLGYEDPTSISSPTIKDPKDFAESAPNKRHGAQTSSYGARPTVSKPPSKPLERESFESIEVQEDLSHETSSYEAHATPVLAVTFQEEPPKRKRSSFPIFLLFLSLGVIAGSFLVWKLFLSPPQTQGPTLAQSEPTEADAADSSPIQIQAPDEAPTTPHTQTGLQPSDTPPTPPTQQPNTITLTDRPQPPTVPTDRPIATNTRPQPPIIPVDRPIVAKVRPRPRPQRASGKPLPWSSVRIERKAQINVYQRTDGERQYTSAHPALCRKIEREAARLLGKKYDISGVTKPWQAFVKNKFAKGRKSKYSFYPRAVVYIIYTDTLKGRSKGDIALKLAKYQNTYAFRRYKDK